MKQILRKLEKIKNTLPGPIQPDHNSMNKILCECEKEGVMILSRIVGGSQFVVGDNGMNTVLRVRMTAEHTWFDMQTHETYGPVRITTNTYEWLEQSMNALYYNKATAIATSLNML